MPDDKSKTVEDSKRVNVHEPYERGARRNDDPDFDKHLASRRGGSQIETPKRSDDGAMEKKGD